MIKLLIRRPDHGLKVSAVPGEDVNDVNMEKKYYKFEIYIPESHFDELRKEPVINVIELYRTGLQEC